MGRRKPIGIFLDSPLSNPQHLFCCPTSPWWPEPHWKRLGWLHRASDPLGQSMGWGAGRSRCSLSPAHVPVGPEEQSAPNAAGTCQRPILECKDMLPEGSAFAEHPTQVRDG